MHYLVTGEIEENFGDKLSYKDVINHHFDPKPFHASWRSGMIYLLKKITVLLTKLKLMCVLFQNLHSAQLSLCIQQSQININ